MLAAVAIEPRAPAQSKQASNPSAPAGNASGATTCRPVILRATSARARFGSTIRTSIASGITRAWSTPIGPAPRLEHADRTGAEDGDPLNVTRDTAQAGPCVQRHRGGFGEDGRLERQSVRDRPDAIAGHDHRLGEPSVADLAQDTELWASLELSPEALGATATRDP